MIIHTSGECKPGKGEDTSVLVVERIDPNTEDLRGVVFIHLRTGEHYYCIPQEGRKIIFRPLLKHGTCEQVLHMDAWAMIASKIGEKHDQTTNRQ